MNSDHAPGAANSSLPAPARAIHTSMMASRVGDGSRMRGWAGLLAFVVPLALYGLTSAPTVTLEDSGEFITAAYWLGVPHPPGYPLWCLIAHAFTWLPVLSVAQRVHLSSATLGALTVWTTYLVALYLTDDWRPALVGALALAASRILWSQSVIAEVYSLNAFFTILLLYLALRWYRTRVDGWLYGLAFAVGLGLTNHQLIGLVALPVFVWLVAVDHRTFLRPRVILGGAALFALGLTVYLYLPIRSAADPPLDIGHTRTLSAVIEHFRRSVYYGPTESGRSAGGPIDVLLHTGAAWRDTARAIGWPLALVALVGIATWPRRDRSVLLVTLAIALCNTLVLNVILTAPYAYLWIYVERVYYIPTHVMAALWVAAGVAALLRLAAQRSALAANATLAVLACLVLLTAATSYPEAHQQGNYVARNLAFDLLDSAPEKAGFLPIGDDVLYPVLYARFVEGMRPDVNLISTEYGWKREPYSVLLSGQPLGDELRKDLPALHDYVSVPRGLVYALVPPSRELRTGYASFVPLPGPPRDQGLEDAGDDLFVEEVRARYAAYHARLGARWIALGERAKGLAELDRAAALDPEDAHVEFLLFQIGRDLKVRPERLRPLLRKALVNFDRKYDPHSGRFDYLQRHQIEEALAELPPDGEQGGPPATSN